MSEVETIVLKKPKERKNREAKSGDRTSSGI